LSHAPFANPKKSVQGAQVVSRYARVTPCCAASGATAGGTSRTEAVTSKRQRVIMWAFPSREKAGRAGEHAPGEEDDRRGPEKLHGAAPQVRDEDEHQPDDETDEAVPPCILPLVGDGELNY